MKVLNYNECAERANTTRRNFERQLADGKGPPIVHISARRRGVLESDFEAWLMSRRQAVPGGAANPPRKRGRPRTRSAEGVSEGACRNGA